MFEGHLVVKLLFFPALLFEGVTDDVRGALEAWIQMKRHICPGLYAIPTGQVNLESKSKNDVSLLMRKFQI